MCKPKYLYWMTNRGGYRSDGFSDAAGNVVSPNSSMVFNMTFQDLPPAPAYSLKLEQFSVNNEANGNVFDCDSGAVVGTQCATGLIELEGFAPHDGSLFATSDTALPDPCPIGSGQVETQPARRRCILSRFDTSFISTADRADCAVAPPNTPSVLVHRPADGDYTFWIRGILNPYGVLVKDNGAGNRRQNMGDWMACISLEPMTDKEMDNYYNEHQDHRHSGLRDKFR